MITAAQTGVMAALLAVAAGTVFEVRPPEAYGVCMACHVRDLVNWTINDLAGTRLTVAPASLVVPVLTPLGVLLGACVAARANGEFRWRRPESPLLAFAYGVIVMTCALVAGGCSIRLLLRASGGELLGALGFAGLAVGVVAGTWGLRWWARR